MRTVRVVLLLLVAGRVWGQDSQFDWKLSYIGHNVEDFPGLVIAEWQQQGERQPVLIELVFYDGGESEEFESLPLRPGSYLTASQETILRWYDAVAMTVTAASGDRETYLVSEELGSVFPLDGRFFDLIDPLQPEPATLTLLFDGAPQRRIEPAFERLWYMLAPLLDDYAEILEPAAAYIQAFE